MKEKVILAYSGGLDTTAIIPWLKETYDYDVVCCCIDCGQGKELEGLEERAQYSGAAKLYIEDICDEFAEDYIIPCVQAGAVYENKYLLGTAMARPGIAKKLVEIASQLNLPEGTVRRWKSTHRWDNERSDKKSERSDKKKRGGQPGNQNATGPPGNKNAVKTGEFEALFFDTLDVDEQKLIQTVQPDKEQLLLQEIQLLTVREIRMLKRINQLRMLERQDPTSDSDSETVPPGMSVTEYSSGIEKGKLTELKKYEGILGQIQSIEDALTRVQARKQKAIETLHKFGYDDAKLELATMQLEFAMLKQDNVDENTTDDGFLDAINATAAEVWGNENE